MARLTATALLSLSTTALLTTHAGATSLSSTAAATLPSAQLVFLASQLAIIISVKLLKCGGRRSHFIRSQDAITVGVQSGQKRAATSCRAVAACTTALSKTGIHTHHGNQNRENFHR